jgi:hypothetical protein
MEHFYYFFLQKAAIRTHTLEHGPEPYTNTGAELGIKTLMENDRNEAPDLKGMYG